MDQGNNFTDFGTPRYAGFWIRFVAAFIDGVILAVPNAVIRFIFHKSFIGGIIEFAIMVAYYAYMHSSVYQASLGKMVVGIKVTDVNYERIDMNKAIIREASKFISALILCIGYIMAGFTEKKQSLHDMIAGTYVVYKA